MAEARAPRVATPRIKIGAPATGADYQPNEDVEERLFDSVNRRRGALVTGPRRSGKTSLLQHVALRLSQSHERTTLVDLQGMRTPFALLAELAPERRREFMLDETETLRTEIPDHIASYRIKGNVDEVLSRLEADVLMLDEVGTALSTERKELFSATIGLIAENIERRGGACVMASGGSELRAALAKSETLRQAASRMACIAMPPWSSSVVTDFIRARLDDVDRDRLEEVVKAIAPGWPMEVAAVARAAFQDTPNDPVEVVVEAVAVESLSLLEQALDTMKHDESGGLALRMLEAMTSIDARVRLLDLAKSVGVPPRRLVAPVERLSDLGIVATDSGEIDQDAHSAWIWVATPMMVRRLRILLGKWRYPKQ